MHVPVCVFGCYVCIVSVFKKTFTLAHVQREEEGKSNLMLCLAAVRFETEQSFVKNKKLQMYKSNEN